MEERLQKILSRYGVASRRQAEVMLLEGRVRVNGNTAQLGDTADVSEDVIEVDGVRLKKVPPRLCIMLTNLVDMLQLCRMKKADVMFRNWFRIAVNEYILLGVWICFRKAFYY